MVITREWTFETRNVTNVGNVIEFVAEFEVIVFDEVEFEKLGFAIGTNQFSSNKFPSTHHISAKSNQITELKQETSNYHPRSHNRNQKKKIYKKRSYRASIDSWFNEVDVSHHCLDTMKTLLRRLKLSKEIEREKKQVFHFHVLQACVTKKSTSYL